MEQQGPSITPAEALASPTASACDTIFRDFKQHGYTLVQLDEYSQAQLQTARDRFIELFISSSTTKARLARLSDDGPGWVKLEGKELIQIQPDGLPLTSSLSQALGGTDMQATSMLDSIARQVLHAAMSSADAAADAAGFATLLDQGPPTQAPCSSLLHASFYAAGAAAPAANPQDARAWHVDRGVVTVIAEDAPGLQVFSSGATAQDVPLRPGLVAVLVGLTLQEATQQRLWACLHGVAASAGQAPAGARLSLAYKLRGRLDAVLDHDVLLKDQQQQAGPEMGRAAWPKRSVAELYRDDDRGSIHKPIAAQRPWGLMYLGPGKMD